MTTNAVIVDDRDPNIHYTGTWEDGGLSIDFSGTATWSPVQGSTANFTFVGETFSTVLYLDITADTRLSFLPTGSGITIFGTVAAVDSPQSSMKFELDGATSGTYTASALASDIHHQPLWTSPTLPEGSHTVLITQTASQGSEGVIFLDYFIYNTTSTGVGPYFIDDRDPRITYTPPWRLFGSDPDFQHTSQGSTSTGDSFSLQFEGACRF